MIKLNNILLNFYYIYTIPSWLCIVAKNYNCTTVKNFASISSHIYISELFCAILMVFKKVVKKTQPVQNYSITAGNMAKSNWSFTELHDGFGLNLNEKS